MLNSGLNATTTVATTTTGSIEATTTTIALENKSILVLNTRNSDNKPVVINKEGRYIWVIFRLLF